MNSPYFPVDWTFPDAKKQLPNRYREGQRRAGEGNDSSKPEESREKITQTHKQAGCTETLNNVIEVSKMSRMVGRHLCVF